MNNRNMINGKKEEEAKKVLQYWIDIANSYWKENDTLLAKKKKDETIDMLEGMILVYNIFAREYCEICFDEDINMYTLEFFE